MTRILLVTIATTIILSGCLAPGPNEDVQPSPKQPTPIYKIGNETALELTSTGVGSITLQLTEEVFIDAWSLAGASPAVTILYPENAKPPEAPCNPLPPDVLLQTTFTGADRTMVGSTAAKGSYTLWHAAPNASTVLVNLGNPQSEKRISLANSSSRFQVSSIQNWTDSTAPDSRKMEFSQEFTISVPSLVIAGYSLMPASGLGPVRMTARIDSESTVCHETAKNDPAAIWGPAGTKIYETGVSIQVMTPGTYLWAGQFTSTAFEVMTRQATIAILEVSSA